MERLLEAARKLQVPLELVTAEIEATGLEALWRTAAARALVGIGLG